MTLLTMLIIPTIVCVAFFIFSKHKITIGEFAAQMGVQVVLIASILFISTSMNMRDTEVWNGEITNKKKVRVSCEHSYPCNPHPCMCDDKGNCSTCWDTCYDHSYDWDWRVYTNIGSSFNIRRVDRQGNSEPPRWTKVKKGQPYSGLYSYKNYVKADPKSLFNKQGLIEKFKGKLPNYPNKIYDYHKLDRLVTVGVKIEDSKEWNKQLMEINKILGPKKQANLIVVVVKNQPREYFHALQQHWLGGKKNDVITVISVEPEKNDLGYHIIQWAEVMAWTSDYMANTYIRNELVKHSALDVTSTLLAVERGVDMYFKRKPMKEFEYLKDAAKPSTGVWIFCMIVGLFASVGLGFFFLRNDVEYNRWHKPFWRK